jgi:hypothetical protein
VLNDIQIEYEIDIELFNKLAKTIKYDHTKKKRDILQFIEELPHKLKLELAMVIHLKMYATVDFFMGKDKSFIAWIVTLIRPLNCESEDYIYKEGEEVFESKNISAIILIKFSLFLSKGHSRLSSSPPTKSPIQRNRLGSAFRT